MHPPLEKRIHAFIELGRKLKKITITETHNNLSVAERNLLNEVAVSHLKNPWFTPYNVMSALAGLSDMLKENKIRAWIAKYKIDDLAPPLTIAVIMAGNLPMVGFHDFMCVLLSGNHFLGKLSGQDKELPVKIAELLIETEPGFKPMISFTDQRISEFDAVIATGNNNTSRYFEYYFGRYPHIIRRNRNSMAILSETEKEKDLEKISDDIFHFFGMGCRSVSLLLIHKGFDIQKLAVSLKKWEHIKEHPKYFNNYEYQKAVMLVNQIEHIDTGFCLLRESQSMASPLSVINYIWYETIDEVLHYINRQSDNIQCIVAGDKPDLHGHTKVQPGTAQKPGPSDYADDIDTLEFLLQLKKE
jgi:hypothetical protein